jgi:hypothetical protein
VILVYLIAVGLAVAYAGLAGRRYSAALNKVGRRGLPGYDVETTVDWARRPIGFRDARLTESMRAVFRPTSDPDLERLRRDYVRRLVVLVTVIVFGLPLL